MTPQVLIAGAGPVGLFLACELRLAGLSVTVLEAQADPRSPLKELPFGLRGLNAPTLDAFDRRGLLPDLDPPQPTKDRPSTAVSAAAHWVHQARRPAGHFAGLQFYEDDIDPAQWRWRLPTPAGTRRAVDMAHLERVLAARAVEMGVDLRRGVAARSVAQTDDAVTVTANGETLRAHWLVGCDGGRSVVRKSAGFDFVGTEPEFTGYSLQVELAAAGLQRAELTPGRHPTPAGMYTFTPPGTFALVDFDGGVAHRTTATRDSVQALLRRITGLDLDVTDVQLATTWTDRAFQATHYRRGRVLLAGDAAHIHSPLGGQGLNLGLGDAMNLGWKLAATERGEAPPDLLDTYTRERHPVGAQVLEWSRAQVALMRPSPASRALADIVRDLMATRDGATYFAERIWGVSLRHDLGDAHPLVGRSLPDFTLVDGRRAGELMTAGQAVLLDFDPTRLVCELDGRWGERLRYVPCAVQQDLGLRAVLARPDGIVAWAGDAHASVDDASRAALRWLGAMKG